MEKGFSNSKENVEKKTDETGQSKTGLAAILENKKFTYTLPGKRQINIFATVVLTLNFLFLLGIVLYIKNQSFHDFIFNFGR